VTRFWKLASFAIGLLTLATLFVATGCGSSSANVRLMNAFVGQSSLDMLINNNSAASSVIYGAASGYASVSSGSPTLQIENTGTTNVLVNQSISLGSGSDSTILATGSGVVVLTDNNSAPSSGNIKIRVINASPTLGTADVYIVPSGSGITPGNPTFASLASQAASGYDSLAAGSYEVIFTQPGQAFAVINSNPLSFSSGQIRSIVGLDGQNGGFTTAVLSDLN
jgi:Domain of unknown function (DUF4397)